MTEQTRHLYRFPRTIGLMATSTPFIVCLRTHQADAALSPTPEYPRRANSCSEASRILSRGEVSAVARRDMTDRSVNLYRTFGQLSSVSETPPIQRRFAAADANPALPTSARRRSRPCSRYPLLSPPADRRGPSRHRRRRRPRRRFA